MESSENLLSSFFISRDGMEENVSKEITSLKGEDGPPSRPSSNYLASPSNSRLPQLKSATSVLSSSCNMSVGEVDHNGINTVVPDHTFYPGGHI